MKGFSFITFLWSCGVDFWLQSSFKCWKTFLCLVLIVSLMIFFFMQCWSNFNWDFWFDDHFGLFLSSWLCVTSYRFCMIYLFVFMRNVLRCRLLKRKLLVEMSETFYRLWNRFSWFFKLSNTLELCYVEYCFISYSFFLHFIKLD